MNESRLPLSTVPHSPVSPEFEEAFTRLVAELPTYLSVLLAQQEGQMILVKRVVDLYPEFEGQPLYPAVCGWRVGKNAARYYDELENVLDYHHFKLIVAECGKHRQMNHSVRVDDPSYRSSFYHLIGHAIDNLPSCNGFEAFSASRRFIDAYARDLEEGEAVEPVIMNGNIIDLNNIYYKEQFAESFRSIFCPEPRSYDELHPMFPRLAEYIQVRILHRLETFFNDPDRLLLFYGQECTVLPWKRTS